MKTQTTSQPADGYSRPLPDALDAERFILGAVLIAPDSPDLVERLRETLRVEDFTLEKHKRIWHVMCQLAREGVAIDRVTLGQRLHDRGWLASVDGLAYVVSLDDGLPPIHNLEAYVDLVREKADLRRLIHTAENAISAALSGLSTPAEVRATLEGQLLSGPVRKADERNAWHTAASIVNAAGGVDRFLAPASGMSLPWPELSETMCGISQGEMVLLAARPSIGKTAAALNLARHVSKTHRVTVFTFEQAKDQLILRLASDIASVDGHLLRKPGQMSLYELGMAHSAIAEIEANENLLFNDAIEPTCAGIRRALKKLIRAEAAPHLIIVDYLQLMRADFGSHARGRTEIVTEISNGLKRIFMELKIAGVVLSQLSRESEKDKRRPQLSDLRESGSLEQDGDKIVFIHPLEGAYADPETRRCEFILAKHRNGPTGLVKVKYRKKFLRFVEEAA